MTTLLRPTPLLLALLLAAPAVAQTDPAIQQIRGSVGVSENRAAERLIREDAEEDAAAERGEVPPEETPVAAEPLPPGQIDVGTVQTEPLEEGEEPDPAADAEDRLDD